MVMLTEVNESVSACARGVGGEHAWERPEARGALSSVSLVAAAVPSFFLFHCSPELRNATKQLELQ